VLIDRYAAEAADLSAHWERVPGVINTRMIKMIQRTISRQYTCASNYWNSKPPPPPPASRRRCGCHISLSYCGVLLECIKRHNFLLESKKRTYRPTYYLHPDLEFYMYKSLLTASTPTNLDVLDILQGR